MSGFKRFVVAALLGVSMIAAPMGLGDGFGVQTAEAHTSRPVKAPRPGKTAASQAYSINEMRPGSCLNQGGGWFLCTGPDNKPYACQNTGDCVRLLN